VHSGASRTWAALLGVLLLPNCQGGGHRSGEQTPASAQAAALSVAPEGSGEHRPARHVLLIVEHENAGFRLRQAQVVESPLPVKRFAEARKWRAEVEDGSGKALFSVAIPAQAERRAEFAGPDGGMQAVHVQSDNFSFVLRVPLLAHGARIRFWDAQVELGSVPYPKGLE